MKEHINVMMHKQINEVNTNAHCEVMYIDIVQGKAGVSKSQQVLYKEYREHTGIMFELSQQCRLLVSKKVYYRIKYGV